MGRLISSIVLIILITGLAVAEAVYPDLTGEQLTVYITFHEEEGRRLLDLFKEKTNCQYTYLTMPAGETAVRVIDEGETPKADIILGGPADVHQMLANKGLLEKYVSPVAKDIPISYKSPDGYWTGIYIGPLSIAINEVKWKKEFADKGIKKPENYSDLLNPVFRGEIIIPSPVSSGTGYTLLASLIQLWGEEEAVNYFINLDKNIGQYTNSGFTVAQRVAVGEYLIGIDFLHDQLLMRKFGFNIISRVPEGAGWEIGCVSVIKNSPNQKAAEVFVDFMLGRETGQIHTDLTERISSRKDVKITLPIGIMTLSEMPINWDYDFFKAAEMRINYQQLWEEKIDDNNDY